LLCSHYLSDFLSGHTSTRCTCAKICHTIGNLVFLGFCCFSFQLKEMKWIGVKGPQSGVLTLFKLWTRGLIALDMEKIYRQKFKFWSPMCNVNNSLFILRDLPQQKNLRALCLGSSPNFICSHVSMEIFIFRKCEEIKRELFP